MGIATKSVEGSSEIEGERERRGVAIYMFYRRREREIEQIINHHLSH